MAVRNHVGQDLRNQLELDLILIECQNLFEPQKYASILTVRVTSKDIVGKLSETIVIKPNLNRS